MRPRNIVKYCVLFSLVLFVAVGCSSSDGDGGFEANITETTDTTGTADDTAVSDTTDNDYGEEFAYTPFINTNYFDFAFGDTSAGERVIDSQYATTAYYNMDETGADPGNMFGVNFADGRIKGYALDFYGNDKTFFVMYVRDNTSRNYGVNNLRDNGDGTVTDLATGLMWMQNDSGYGMEWKDALAYCENLEYAGHTDWRLPNAKELQSIVDYTRMPDATGATTPSIAGPPIDTDFFNITSFTNYNGDEDWGFFWSGSTHASSDGSGGWGAYVAFGRALGKEGDTWIDVHGAGCQRSDPKYDDGTDYSDGHGPQNDAVYVYNYVRAVRYDESVTNPTYVVVDTNQTASYDNSGEISAPEEGADFYGQDAQYQGPVPSYTDNGDGTITDNNTGLMWQKSPDTNGDGEILADDKYSFDEAVANASSCTTGGYTDWRLPTIKELYSLFLFSGEDPSSETISDTTTDSSDSSDATDSSDDQVDGTAYDLASAAALLGVTESELQSALGDPAQGEPDFTAAAVQLGVTEQELMDALGVASDDSDETDDDASTDIDEDVTYPVVDTGQTECYDSDGETITCPAEGEAFYGQDAQFSGNQPSYTDNGDGTVTDNVTGLMWQQVPVNQGFKYQEAVEYCESLELSGYDDWRIPTTKELFSISNFSKGWPYLDTTYFHIAGDSVSKDEQYWTEKYVGTTVQGQSNAAFGVNHGTGHIKAYPAESPMGNYVRAVRGNAYGVNDFENNGDGTVTDHATGLMWSQADSGEGILWADALAYAENSELAGYDDWRLPNVKELQSIVDYSYSPTATDPNAVGPAIDPIFDCTPIINEAGNDDYPYFWSSTSARFKAGTDFYYAWYVAFGMAVNPDGQDYHGAGAMRYDTKALDGPAGEDAARAYNYVRLVRGGNVEQSAGDDPAASSPADTSDDQTDTSGQMDEQPEQPANPTDGQSAPPDGPANGDRPDLSAAAVILDVTEADLQSALGDPSQGQPDFAEAAAKLGVTEQELMDALGISPV